MFAALSVLLRRFLALRGVSVGAVDAIKGREEKEKKKSQSRKDKKTFKKIKHYQPTYKHLCNKRPP